MDIKGISHAMLRGAYDSIRGMTILPYLDQELNERKRNRLSPSRATTPIRRRESDISKENTARPLKKHEESKVLTRTFQCSFLNGGIFLLSMVLFEYVLLPLISFFLQMIFGSESIMSTLIWAWIHPILIFIFQTIWVLPLFLLSKVVNSLWFQDIADSAYRYSRGRPHQVVNISKMIADSLFSIAVQALFLVQAMLVEYIPIYLVGRIFSMVHMSLLYSLYTFEYKWFNMGWELHRRLTYLETNWPYFIGFGMPLTILTQLSEKWFVNGCIFSILFPLFIISGNEANPVTGVCEYPLHLFSPVIAISNAILNKSIGATKVSKPSNLHQHNR